MSRRFLNGRAPMLGVIFLMAGWTMVGGIPRASAAPLLSFTVTTTADLPDVHPGDGVCADKTAQCSLRAALEESNAEPAGTTTEVSVPAGSYALSRGPLVLTANAVDVTGAGTSTTIVKNGKNHVGPLVTVAPKATAAFTDMKFTGGSGGTRSGGAISNSGTTTLAGVVVAGNTASSGGGLANAKGAALTLDNAIVTNDSALSASRNSAPGGSGGGILNAGQLKVTGSTIANNVSGSGGFGSINPGGHGGSGGGIANTGTTVIVGSTITANDAGSGGTGQANNETAGPGGDGGGIYSSSGSVTLSNSVVSDNVAGYAGVLGEAPFPKAGDGGGIWSSAALHLSGTSFSSNTTADPNSSSYAEPGAGGSGGAVYTTGTATVDSSSFRANSAGQGEQQGPGGGGNGGAIANAGTLTLTNSTLSANSAGNGGGSASGGAGGGLFSSGGSATLSGDTLSGNVSGAGGNAISVDPGCATPGRGGDGGALYSSASLGLLNSTLSGNEVGQGGYWVSPCAGQAPSGVGAGVAVGGGTSAVSWSTIAGNADGIANLAGTVTVNGSIVADNTGTNCSGAVSEGTGFNLDSGHGCGFSAAGDLEDTEPMLGALGANGGATQTQALLAGSPAIDHGGTSADGCPSTDQRGDVRPDETSDAGTCDIGAYESQGTG